MLPLLEVHSYLNQLSCVSLDWSSNCNSAMLLNYSYCEELLVDCIIHSCMPPLCNALRAPKDQWMKWNAPSLQHLRADTESARVQNFRYIVRDNYWIVVTISIGAGWEGRQCIFLLGRFESDITVKRISEYSRQWCSANILNIQCTQYDPKTCSTVYVQILWRAQTAHRTLQLSTELAALKHLYGHKKLSVWFKRRKMNSCSKN